MRTKVTRYEVASATRTGLRATNADAVLAEEAAGIFAVADGMGDVRASRNVAAAALDAMRDVFSEEPWLSLPPTERSGDEATARLYLGLVRAHRRTYAPSIARRDRIGTTFAGVVVCGRTLCVGHVGNSRVYLLRPHNGTLARLTQDHTGSVRAMQGGMPADEARRLPEAHKLTRALGVNRHVSLDCRVQPWEPGDIALLCTDGVSDPLDDTTIARTVQETCDVDLAGAAETLVDRATEGVGVDNATVVLLRWVG